MMNEALATMLTEGICAVLRHIPADPLQSLVEALAEGGIHSVEVTLNTDGAYEMIHRLSTLPNIVVGAGTVVDGEGAERALDAGAKFLVSPHTRERVWKVGERHGIPTVPGACTPTEIFRAYEMGASLIKVFPANVVGPRFFHEMRGPYSHLTYMATGGINESNIMDFIMAGVSVVGVGSSLFSLDDIHRQDWKHISDVSQNFVSRVQEARGRTQ